jgi:hypothetical protein
LLISDLRVTTRNRIGDYGRDQEAKKRDSSATDQQLE